MLKNKTTEEQAGAQRGWQVIEEAAWLLRQMRFSQHHGAYAEGQQVAISIDPRWNTDNETIHVLITCYAFAHRRADWAKLPLHILPEGGRAGVYTIARLNRRGQVVIPRLPAGEYRISLRLTPARVEPVLYRQPESLAAQGEDASDERRVWRGEGEGGAVTWRIGEKGEGDVPISFEKMGEKVAGNVVPLCLFDPDTNLWSDIS